MKDNKIMKVTIDGIEYVRAHTPEVKEEKRREIVVVNEFNKITCVCSDLRVTGITGAMRNLERAEFVEIKENEIIVSDADIIRAFDRYIYGVSKNIVINELFKKDGV